MDKEKDTKPKASEKAAEPVEKKAESTEKKPAPTAAEKPADKPATASAEEKGATQKPAANAHSRRNNADRRGGGGPRGRGGKRGGPGGRRRGGPGGRERAKPEFDQKVISIRRVTRVVAGGRRFSFSVAMVAGDRKGRVGVGVGKATDISKAIEKAFRSAKKNMVTVKLTKQNSIPHEVAGRYCTSEIVVFPARGRGLVAGSSVRNVLEFAGVTDVTAKIISRSKNRLNNAHAALQALDKVKGVSRTK